MKKNKMLQIIVFTLLVMLAPVVAKADAWTSGGYLYITTQLTTSLEDKVDYVMTYEGSGGSTDDIIHFIISDSSYGTFDSLDIAYIESFSAVKEINVANTIGILDVGDNFFGNTIVSRVIEKVTFPGRIFGENAFEGCNNLTDVSLPDATTLGNKAFYSCHSLKNVDMPDAKIFGDLTFAGCHNLTSIALPSATSFGDDLFYNTTQSIALTLGNTPPTVGTMTVSPGSILYVPQAVYLNYDNDPNDTLGANNDGLWYDWPIIGINESLESGPAKIKNPQTGQSTWINKVVDWLKKLY